MACAVFVTGPKSANVVADELRAAELGGAPSIDVISEDAAASYLMEPGNRVACIDATLRGSPWGLTWAHKAVFRELVLKERVFERGVTHLIYSEDDMALAPDALSYWCEYRAPLAAYGLMPGFLRVEGPDDDLCVTGWRRNSRGRPRVALASNPESPDSSETVWFVNLFNPYQAMYILDEELANWHFRYSLFRSRARSRFVRAPFAWGVPESAAAGAIVDGVIPAGFRTRNVFPLVPGSSPFACPLAPALTRHLPRKDYDDPDVPQGKQRLSEAFVLDGVSTDAR